MPDYSIDDLLRDLRDALAPHSISIDAFEGTEHDFILRTSRINGTRRQRKFHLHVAELTPDMAQRMIEAVLGWYDARP